MGCSNIRADKNGFGNGTHCAKGLGIIKRASREIKLVGQCLAAVGVQEVEMILFRFETSSEVSFLCCRELCFGRVGKGTIIMSDGECFGGCGHILRSWEFGIRRRRPPPHPTQE